MERKTELPLTGIRVLDLTHLAAGPWCTLMLADAGADVIKVEPPGRGDIARNMGGVYDRGHSAIFLGFNRNKRSLAIDLRSRAGQRVFHRLVETADVIVENFRPGTVNKLGVDYETLCSINPRIVYCSISAFGQKGPYSGRPANDPIIQAMSGSMALTGEKGRGPVRQAVSLPDFGSGTMAAFAIMLALFHRASTGRGRKIELSLLDTTIFSLGPRAQEFLINHEDQPALGSAHPQFAPYQAFKCLGGDYLYVACINDKFWVNLCRALDRPELASDERFATNPARLSHREQLNELLEPIFSGRTRDAWIELLDRYEVPCGPVYQLSEAFSDPQVVGNRLTVTVPHPAQGSFESLRVPIGMLPAGFREQMVAPPLLGQHSVEVLLELGFSQHEIDSLAQEGVIQVLDRGPSTADEAAAG